MTWDEIDWAALARLRERFLHGAAGTGPYWQDAAELASYDFTYGERIGWKWDQTLRELRLRGWAPAQRTILDWGCGSGIASRRVIEFFGPEQFDTLWLWDHSPAATAFAEEAARAAFPRLEVAQSTPGLLAGTGPIGLLVLSHVLNELTAEDLAGLRTLAARAEAILWVEPGTHDVSRQLGSFREALRATGFRVAAPCTHENECPMFAIGNERHWCHFFAPPPGKIFADPNWVKFGQRAGIDLRSLPYAFIALDRSGPPGVAPVSNPHEALQTAGAADLSRIIGRPEHLKPYARFYNCDATGLSQLELPKRANPALYKQLDRTKSPLVYRWQRTGARILAGDTLIPAGA